MTILKRPSAWFPLVMSAFALLLVVGYVGLYGVQRSSEDETTVARLFQLLLVGQLPITGYFAVKWFPKQRKETVQIVVIQILAAFIPLTVVMLMGM